jgi:exopolysaccharide biosynthesis polyprenyl glycosylphosphotransferase
MQSEVADPQEAGNVPPGVFNANEGLGEHLMLAEAVRSAVRAGRRGWEKPYARCLAVTDALIVIGAVELAQYVRFGKSSLTEGLREDSWTPTLSLYSALLALLWLAALAIFRTRSPRIIGEGLYEYVQVFNASFWTFGAIAIGSLLLKLDIARGYLAVALPVGTLGLLLGRYLWRGRLARAGARGVCQTSVIAIGDRRAVSLLAREITRNPKNGYRIVGVGIPGYDDSPGSTLTVGHVEVPIIGNELHAIEAIGDYGADTVAITDTEHFGAEGIRRLLWELESIDVDLVVSPGVMDIGGQRLMVRPVSGYPLIHVEKPQYQGAKRFRKRAFDTIFALMALAAAAPVLLIAAIAIKLNSPGPVFYAAERIGLDGKPFTMLKLRTMVADANAQLEKIEELNDCPNAVLFKMRNDPRVTSVGKYLRRFSIDEIPQFINVVMQQMSVVGPRPPLRSEVDTYDGQVKRRLLVRPGVTGLWQVSGRSDLDWEESVRLDLFYVENWSMAGDVAIIAKTLRAVLLSKGAY